MRTLVIGAVLLHFVLRSMIAATNEKICLMQGSPSIPAISHSQVLMNIFSDLFDVLIWISYMSSWQLPTTFMRTEQQITPTENPQSFLKTRFSSHSYPFSPESSDNKYFAVNSITNLDIPKYSLCNGSNVNTE